MKIVIFVLTWGQSANWMRQDSLEATARSQMVRVARLDDCLRGIDEIRALKTDLEGVGIRALLGAKGLFCQWRIAHVVWDQNKSWMRQLRIGENKAADFMRSAEYEQVLSSTKWKTIGYASYNKQRCA